MTPLRVLGICFMVGGVAYWLLETAYWGWNLHPCCISEAQDDMRSLAIFAFGFILCQYDIIEHLTYERNSLRNILKEKTKT